MNLRDIYSDSLHEIKANSNNWRTFLAFSSQLYKYSFIDKVSIHKQKPDASFLADFDTWAKIGRYPRRGQKSIVVADNIQDRIIPKHLFDLSQTHGEKFDEPDWKGDNDLAQQVISQFYQSVFKVNSSEVPLHNGFEDLIYHAVKNYEDADTTGFVIKNRQLIENSILYSISTKAPWLNPMYDDNCFNDIQSIPMGIEVFTVGNVVNEVSRHALMKIHTIKQGIEKELKIQEELTHEQEESIELPDYDSGRRTDRDPTFKQRRIRDAFTRLRENGNDLSKRSKSSSLSIENSRRNINGVSSPTGEQSDRSRNSTTKEAVKREPISKGNRPHEESTTLERLNESSKGSSSGRDVTGNSDQPVTSGTRHFSELKGTLNNNKRFRFIWREGEDARIWLDNSRCKLQSDFPQIKGNSDSFDIIEKPTMNKLFSIKSNRIETRSILELRQSFENISNDTVDTFLFEKELFEKTKATKSFTSGGTIDFQTLVTHRDYLDYLKNPDLKKDNSIQLNALKANPEVEIGMMGFPEDKAVYFLFRNKFHTMENSIYSSLNDVDLKPNEGLLNEQIFAIIEDSSLESDFEVLSLSKIRVRSLQKLSQLVDSMTTEITEEGLSFERDLLYAAKDQVCFEKGSVLSESELELLKKHLSNLNPYSETVEEIRLDDDPRVDSTVFNADSNNQNKVVSLENKEKPFVQELLFEGSDARNSNLPDEDFFQGTLPSNENFRFTWNGGNITTVNLYLPFAKLDSQIPGIEGYSAVFEVVEDSNLGQLFYLKSGKLVTRSKEELHSLFKLMSINEGDTEELEERLFKNMRTYGMDTNGISRTSEKITFSKLKDHYDRVKRYYDPYLFKEKYSDKLLKPISSNSQIEIGLVPLSQDDANYLVFRNNYHINQYSNGHIQESRNQGYMYERLYTVIYNREMEHFYRVDSTRQIYTNDINKFHEFIADLSKGMTLDGQLFERELLKDTEYQLANEKGNTLSDSELLSLEKHLDNLESLTKKISFETTQEVTSDTLTEDPNSLELKILSAPTVIDGDKKGIIAEEVTDSLSLFDFEYDDSLENNQAIIKVTSEVPSVSRNYYSFDDALYQNGKKAKCQDNLIALDLLDTLERQQTQATLEEQATLAKYSGWGGIPEIFDEKLGNWEEERNQLKSLLSKEEYAEVRSTVLTAFFTDPKLIRSMYKFAENFGDFSKGNILDPAMGTGNFFQSLPKNLRKAHLTGIELDGLTGRLAKQLYPDAAISIKGFEKVKLKEKMDLVVGNFPFNNIKVLDTKYDKYNFVVHDYFMAKSIDSLNQKGLMIFITSSGSMDKKDIKAREYLAKRADFIGAVRLPKSAFKQSAGTEVISDILIFQKKTMQEMMVEYQEPDWVRSKEHPEYPGLFMNEYFMKHPEQILGEIRIKNFQGQTLDVVLSDDLDLSEEIDQAFERILQEIEIEKIVIREKLNLTTTEVLEEIIVPEETSKFSFFMVNNRAYYHTTDGEFEEYKGTMNQTRISNMIPVREAVSDVLAVQQFHYEEDELKEKLERLNKVYDEFVRKCGYMNDPVNIRILRSDNKFPLLLSLEKETDTGFEKQPIFYQATVRPKQLIENVKSAKDAVQISMTKRRQVDFDYIQEIYPNHSVPEIIEELGKEIYLNPEKLRDFNSLPEENIQAWEIADEYLTGNVKGKLDNAIAIRNATNNQELMSYLDQSIGDLKEAQPERLLEGDIKFQIGSPWIPVSVYNDFMHELFQTPNYMKSGSGNLRIDYLDHNASWRVLRKGQNKNSVIVTQKYGTNRTTGYELIELSLNLQKATIKDRVIDGDTVKYILNPKETMIARGKQEDIEHEFQKWLFQDQERSKILLDIYNDRFNTNVPRKYNGENLTFDEMNLQVELRPHQKDVIARILYSGEALMAHEVGAGKTAAMLSAGMYLKQNGLVNKPLYVVPNHLTEQWGKEIMTFYPNANILITTKKDFEKQNRQSFVSRIATGNYDAVIIGHSQFERIPLSEERQRENLNRQIEEATNIVSELKEAEAESWSIKQIERFRKGLETKLEKLSNESKKDDVITFEELGVDFLFVDEAHVYKNLFIYTKMQNVAGVGKSNSQRASDMLSKVRYIQEMNDGKNVVFATGTPVSNSMSELYVMQYFLQPEELRIKGLNSFDSWAATFGQVTSTLEITPEGAGYRIRDRFSKFHNLPELMAMFHQVADIQTADMLNLPVPELKTGGVQTVVTARSYYQEMKMDEFVTRSEKIRNNMVDPSEDNMLKLTNEAKLMAIDARLLDESLERDPESKLSICSEKVYSIWKQHVEAKSTQIIFSDSGTPKPDKFNVYQEIKDQLIEKGLPEKEIAFIHDAKTDQQRDALFDKVRSGEVRVIIGSTQKLGTGTNIQDKLIAAHHIDCPWKPSDLTQREGRILRQGNENDTVEIYRYVTKGTFDSYLWQIQEQKLTYISQVMNGSNINRSMDDLDETVLSAAEVKAIATDNPLLAEKMSIDNEVTRLQLIRSQWSNTRSRMDKNIRETYPNKIAYLNDQLKKLTNDLSLLQSNSTQDFSMEVNGQQIDNREDAFAQINALALLKENSLNKENGSSEIRVGSYRGLEVYIEKTTFAEDNLSLRGESSYRTRFTPETKSGNITRLMNLVNHVSECIDDVTEDIKDTELQLNAAKREMDSPFPQQEELDQFIKEQSTINREIELQTMEKEVYVEETAEESLSM